MEGCGGYGCVRGAVDRGGGRVCMYREGGCPCARSQELDGDAGREGHKGGMQQNSLG